MVKEANSFTSNTYMFGIMVLCLLLIAVKVGFCECNVSEIYSHDAKFRDQDAGAEKCVLAVTNIVVAFPIFKTFFSDEDVTRGLRIGVLFDKGSDMSAYRVMESDMAMITSADAYVSLGTPFDGELIRQGKTRNPSLKVFCPTNSCKLVASNPYIWLNPDNVVSIENELHRLIYATPENMRGRCHNLMNNALGRNGYTIAITNHGFEYFTSFYGPQSILFSKSDSAEHRKKKVEEARSRHVNRLLAFSFEDEKYIANLSRELGCKVIRVDPTDTASVADLPMAVLRGFLEKSRDDDEREMLRTH